MKFRIFFILMVISVLSAQESAFIYIENTNEVVNVVGTSWTNVGAGGGTANFVESSTSANWSYAGNILTASSNAAVAGYYCIKYSLSFNADIAVWSMGISIDGANPSEPIFTRSISNDRKDAGNMSGVFMALISPEQTIQMVVKSSLPNKDFSPSYAQLTICPAAQSPNNFYAGMNINSSTAFNSLSTSFTKLTGFSAIPEINGWTFGTSDLTANTGSAGLYYMSYSVSFTGDSPESAPDLYTFELVVNGVNGDRHVLARRTTSGTDIGNISAGGLLSINEGNTVSIEAKSAKNGDLIIHNATLSMFKLAEPASPQATGIATITNDQTVSISAIDTWTTIGNYASPGSNHWDFASNVFTPNDIYADGFYYMEYSTSLSTNNLDGDDVELGVFVGASVKPSLTVKRRLSNNTDVGAVCGLGLLSVNDFTSTITLKIKNTTTTSDLVIKKSLVGFSQIRYVNDPATPITLNSFDVEEQQGVVSLHWQTASEVENLGYKIYKKEAENDFQVLASFVNNDELRGQGCCSELTDYTYVDENVISGHTYTYLLEDVSYDLRTNKHVDITRSIHIPKKMFVGEAYPNPFNPQSVIPIELDRGEQMSIALFDIKGRKVQSIADQYFPAGIHYFTIGNSMLQSGLYFVNITTENDKQTRKVLLVR